MVEGTYSTYVWEDSSSVVIDSSYNSLVSNLSAGIYSVTVYDSTGCMAVDFTEILKVLRKISTSSKKRRLLQLQKIV